MDAELAKMDSEEKDKEKKKGNNVLKTPKTPNIPDNVDVLGGDVNIILQ